MADHEEDDSRETLPPLADVRRRYASRSADAPRPELPFCIDLGDGRRFDAMRQVRGTLAGLIAILLGLAAAITLCFTTGVVLMVLLGAAGLATVMWLLHRVALASAGRAWLAEAQPFAAALVMANTSVFQPGQSIVPGVLLVDFGDTPDTDRLQEAAARVGKLTEGEVAPGHTAVRDWLLAGMQRADFSRVRLPRDLAGADGCWLVSLRLDRAAMPNGHLDRRLWFVLARRDREESAELLPHCYWHSV